MAASQASKATAAGSAPMLVLDDLDAERWAQMESCSTAAARKVSQAATMTVLSWTLRYWPSLAMEVVLPAPLTPADEDDGGFSGLGRRRAGANGVRGIRRASRFSFRL